MHEREFVRLIVERLEALGLKVTKDVRLPSIGGRADIVGETKSGQPILLEVKVNTSPEVLRGAYKQLEKYKEATKISTAYVIVPEVPANIHTQNNYLLSLEGLIETLNGILSEEISSIPSVFVAMPFEELFHDTYYVAIVGASKATGLQPVRMDAIIFDDLILAEMHRKIKEASIFLADLSEGNPNVMYELGYAKALEKRTILISATPVENLPFDVRGWPVLNYKMGQTNKLIGELSSRMEKLLGK